MTTEFYAFSELGIDSSDIEKMMGFEPGHSPAPFPEIIETGLRKGTTYLQASGGYRIFDNFAVDLVEESVKIDGQVFYPGKTAAKKLNSATQAVLFACTAGPGISELSKRQSAQGDELMGYVLDVIGSLAVDKTVLLVQERILEKISHTGKGLTDWFSPGHCSWDLEDQKKLFALLPKGFCNIYLSDSLVMHPAKSASGIAGIGTGCQQTGFQCNWCNDEKCIYKEFRPHKNPKKNV